MRLHWAYFKPLLEICDIVCYIWNVKLCVLACDVCDWSQHTHTRNHTFNIKSYTKLLINWRWRMMEQLKKINIVLKSIHLHFLQTGTSPCLGTFMDFNPCHTELLFKQRTLLDTWIATLVHSGYSWQLPLSNWTGWTTVSFCMLNRAQTTNIYIMTVSVAFGIIMVTSVLFPLTNYIVIQT